MARSRERAYLHRDDESFTKPLAKAFTACAVDYTAAANTVRGAEARTRAVLEDYRDLQQFEAQVEDLIRTRSFHNLPGLRRGRENLDGYHHLTVGPWRGVFLVDPASSGVLAVLFSKRPHDLERRIDEIAAAYRTEKSERADGGSLPE